MAVTINKFTLVQVLAVSDNKATVQPWSPAAYEQPGLSTAHKTLGVTMTDSDYGEPVAVMRRGYLRNVSDGAETWSVGAVLWAASNGSATSTKPTAPLPGIVLGVVYADEGAGLWTIAVDVRVMPSLGELSGVLMETPADKDVFIYKAATNVWEPRQIDHGADIAGLLDDDHTQYLKERLSGGAESEVPGHSHQAVASAGTLDHGLANTAASLLDNDHPLYQRKHGFTLSSAGAATQTLTYDKTTRKVTLTPTGATFTFYVDGVQFIKTGAQVSGAHAAAVGKHFFYYDSSGVLQTSTTPWSILDRTTTPVALVYWDDISSDGWCFYECHTADTSLEMHYHDHFSEGTKFLSGGTLGGYALTTETDAGVTFSIGTTVVADEDINRSLTAVSDGGPYMVIYRSGASGNWTFDSTLSLPYKYGVGSYIQYNDQNAGGAGVWGLTSAGSGNFCVYYLMATTGVQSARQFFLVPDQAATGTLAAAQARSVSQISWGSLPFEEVTPLYRIIFRTGAGYGSTGKVRIEEVLSIINLSATAITGAAPSIIHNDLSGRSAASTHPASSITFAPYSTLASTDVQAAIQELLDESGGGATTLNGLTDVDTSGVGDGDVLAYDSGDSTWKPAAAGGAGGALSTLSDVDLTGLGDEDFLRYDSGTAKWIKITTAGVAAAVQSAIQLDNLAAPDDNTDLNATTSAHGLLKKLSNVSTEFMNGQGNWATPAGGAATVRHPRIFLDLRYPKGTGTGGTGSTLVGTVGAHTIMYNVNSAGGDADTIPLVGTGSKLTRCPRLMLTAANSRQVFYGPSNVGGTAVESPVQGTDGYRYVLTFGVEAFAAQTHWGLGLFKTGAEWDGAASTAITHACLGLARDASETDWYFIHNDDSGAPTRVDTGIPVTNDKMCRLTITVPEGGASVDFKLEQEEQTTATATVSSNIPTATTMLLWYIWQNKGAGTTPKISICDLVIDINQGSIDL